MITWQISVLIQFRIVRIWPFEQWSNTGFRSLDHNFYPKMHRLATHKWTKTVTRHVIIIFGEKDWPKLHFQQVSQRAKIVKFPYVNLPFLCSKITTGQLRQNYNKSINKFIYKKSCPKGNSFRQCSLEGHLDQLRVIVRSLNGIWFELELEIGR